MPAIPRVDRIKNIYTAAKALNFGFRLSATNPQAVLFDGISGHFPQLQRVTIRFCKISEPSAGLRNYIEHSLTKFASENPYCSIYILPVRNTTPSIRAEYSNGREVQLDARDFSMEHTSLYMNYLRTRSGLPIYKFENPQFSPTKSIQGMWSPTTWQNTAQNLYSCGSLPQQEFSTHLEKTKGATETLQQMTTKERILPQFRRKLGSIIQGMLALFMVICYFKCFARLISK
uniref:Large ribosomal subunit protein mL43 n=1 Tax=Meloidogyne incognita TaxID=6306 RepID=A0A914MA89_MELIC